jgi:hypothetical protein
MSLSGLGIRGWDRFVGNNLVGSVAGLVVTYELNEINQNLVWLFATR